MWGFVMNGRRVQIEKENYQNAKQRVALLNELDIKIMIWV